MPAAVDFAINSSKIGESYSPWGPAVAILADGRALVVWVVTGVDPESGSEGFGAADIKGRWINADGSFAGADFTINTTVESFQLRPAATVTADGRVFVAWENGEAGLRGIWLDPDGVRPALEIALNAVPGNPGQIDVAGLSDGRVVAVWNSPDAGDGDGQTIRMRFVDGTGAEIVVNSTGAGTQYAPDVVEMADGRILVSYSSFEGAGASPIRARVFAADGTPVAQDYVLTEASELSSGQPAVTVLADGRMLATWVTAGARAVDEDGYQTQEPGTIRGRLLDMDGQPLGDSFAISTTLSRFGPGGPGVVALPDGGAFVGWYSGDSGDGDWGCLRGRMLDVEGRPLGSSDMVLNSTQFNLNGNPSLAVGPEGRVLVSWSDEGDYGADAVTRGVWITPALGQAGDETMTGTAGADMMMGLGGADRLLSGAGHDMQMGGTGRDRLAGGQGNDILVGEAGADRLIGGAGQDTMTGGDGADCFVFRQADLNGAGDQITDMTREDRIDLSGIDANVHLAGDDAFVFIGDEAFSAAGQLRFQAWMLEGDRDGDGVADFALRLSRVADLTGMDIVL